MHKGTLSAWNVFLASSLFGLTAPAWSATGTAPDGVVLWSGNDQWIRIEQQDAGAAPNNHPVQLSSAEVNSALTALRVRVIDEDSGSETQRAVFTRSEIDNLAPQVVAGLGKAGPQQDVTFSTIGSHALSAGGLVKDPGVNAGRVFYQDGKLNVIFGELQSNYRKKNVYGQRDQDFTPRRQGSRSKASKQKYTLVTSPAIQLHANTGGGVREDWVLIDPAAAAAQLAATSAAAAAPPPPVAAPSTATAPPAASPSPAPAAASAPVPAAAKSSADLEQRLQKLKDLRDKGLISEEVYNSKVKELLSEL